MHLEQAMVAAARQRTDLVVISSERSPAELRGVRSSCPAQRRKANRAAPYAPMSPAMSGRLTSRCSRFSMTRSRASFMKEPPCTSTRSPSSSGVRRRSTLYRALRMTA